jgi:hypothetical protein
VSGVGDKQVPAIDLTHRRCGRAVIWVNSSHQDLRFVREAERSAKTLKEFIDEAIFVSVSDRIHRDLDPVFDYQAVADFSVPIRLREKVHFNGQMIAKLSTLKLMTWDRTMYLGSDIAALRPEVRDIFRLLDGFDIAVAHAPTRIYSLGERDNTLLSLPDCFPEMNCDLIAFRRSDAMGEFLAEWERVYSANLIDHPHDQGAFRHLLFESNLRVCILPPEYNYRGHDYWPKAVVLQRREAIPTYAKHYPHLAAIHPTPGKGLFSILRRFAGDPEGGSTMLPKSDTNPRKP